MTAEPRRSSGVGTAVAVVAAFLALFHWVGVETWGFGQTTILRMLAIALVVLAAPRLVRLEARVGTERFLGFVAIVAASWLAFRLSQSVRAVIANPGRAHGAIDIARNVYEAGTQFLAGRNPYATRTQLGHVVGIGPHVTIEDGVTRMYGLRYPYGFPYFPTMMFAYLPFRRFGEGFHAIRVGNAFYLALGAAGALWLASRSVTRGARTLAIGLSLVAYLAIDVLAPEHFDLAVTDICISAFAVFAFVAASYGRPLATGVILGVVQAAKLLPGPMVALPAIALLGTRRERLVAFATYGVVSLAFLVPAVVPDAEAFFASTVAFYLTYHAEGDDTSLYWFLPEWAKPAFLAIGFVVAAYFTFRGLRTRPETPAIAARDAWLAYFLFTAFNRMTHLNYLWAVHALGAVAVACVALSPALRRERRIA